MLKPPAAVFRECQSADWSGSRTSWLSGLVASSSAAWGRGGFMFKDPAVDKLEDAVAPSIRTSANSSITSCRMP